MLPSMTMWLGLTWLVATVKILFVSFAHVQFMEGYLPLLGRPITMLGALASMSSDACVSRQACDKKLQLAIDRATRGRPGARGACWEVVWNVHKTMNSERKWNSNERRVDLQNSDMDYKVY